MSDIVDEYLNHLNEGPIKMFRDLKRMKKNIEKAGVGLQIAGGGILTGIAVLIARSFTKCHKACRDPWSIGQIDTLQKACISRCKIDSYTKAIIELEKRKAKCKDTDKFENCVRLLDSNINKLKNKIKEEETSLKYLKASK